MADLNEMEEMLSTAINTGWILMCAFLVFWEQAGFAMWESGSLPQRSLHNILLKNLLDAAITTVAFLSFGYTLAFGDGTGFAGDSRPFLTRGFRDYSSWVFQWAFAATAATTVSGCVAERTQFVAYLLYSFVISAVIYPIAVHWVWADNGWMCAWADPDKSDILFDRGMIDFAGSGLVHMLGGVAGLVGSVAVGPRLGRFPGKDCLPRETFEGHSIAMSTLGVYCLWFGWFGFNAGYTMGLTNGMAETASLVALNTAVAPSFSALTCLLIERFDKGHWDLATVLNAIVAGLVSITGPCAVVEPGGAAVIVVIGAVVYCGGYRLHEKLRIDDPVHAAAVHAWPGLWGLIAPGFLAAPRLVEDLEYTAGAGLFYGEGWDQLGTQVVGALVLLCWVVATTGFLFFGLAWLGCLRVSEADERAGLDVAKHGVAPAAEAAPAVRLAAAESAGPGGTSTPAKVVSSAL